MCNEVSGGILRRGFLASFVIFAFVFANSANAQFDKLLKQINANVQAAGVGAPAAPGVPGQVPTGGKKKSGLKADDTWCATEAGALGKMKPDIALVAQEFRIENIESLQDVFDKAFQRKNISRTFPDARFFQQSFETARVRAIYDVFLAFPEPSTLAALIQLSNSADQQERGDALMALVFLHLQAPELSASPDRWKVLAEKAYAYPHYTALVFRGRTMTYGEYAPQNINAAVGYLNEAGSLPAKYKQVDGIRQEFDIDNYQIVRTATLKDIMNSGQKFTGRNMMESFAKTGTQVEAAQKAYADRFPSTRLGRIFKEVERINGQAIAKGKEIIGMSQGGNQLAGQRASMASLQGTKEGDKQTFVDINPEAQKAQLKLFAQIDTVNPEQKRVLIEAQEKRYEAQGLMANSLSELIAEMTRDFGDFIKMTAPLEAIKQANAAQVQSCAITAKWEQAMRAKDIPATDKKKAATVVASDLSRFTDD